MSIYCTSLVFENEWPDETGPSPILYQGSHVLPHFDDTRGGSLDLAYIPGYITQDGRDDAPTEDHDVWPYLRLAVNQDTVILDYTQVRILAEELQRWMQRVQGTPE